MKREHPLDYFYKTIDHCTIEEKVSHLPDFPRIIEFEITNHCNFHCLMCKTGVGTALRERGFMSSQVFDRVIEQIKDKGSALKFVGQGEPLLHKNFMDFIRKAKENHIICHLTTNGSILDEAYMEELVDSGLDSIKFSFQGVDASGYKSLRQRNDFDSLLLKIKKLYNIRGEKAAPFITICTSVTSESQEQIHAFKKQTEKFCDKVEVGITTLDFIDIEHVKDSKEREQLRILQKEQMRKKQRYECCHQVFDVITVRWNGDITACCADNDGIMTLGNIEQMSIEECWNSKKENSYRKILANRDYEALPLCRDCYDVMGYTIKEKAVN